MSTPTVFLILFLTTTGCYSKRLTPQQIDHKVEILREFVTAHANRTFENFAILPPQSCIIEDLDPPIVKEEHFCRCNVDHCDENLVMLGGDTMRGICRAAGGVCRQLVHISLDGKVKSARLE